MVLSGCQCQVSEPAALRPPNTADCSQSDALLARAPHPRRVSAVSSATTRRIASGISLCSATSPDDRTKLADSGRFDRFEIQPHERRLLVDGTPAAVSGRAFDLLLTLVHRTGPSGDEERTAGEHPNPGWWSRRPISRCSSRHCERCWTVMSSNRRLRRERGCGRCMSRPSN